MKKTFGFLLALAPIAWSGFAAAAVATQKGNYDARVPDARLNDAEEFGRYADVARKRAAAVSTPDWQAGMKLAHPDAQLKPSQPYDLPPAAAIPSPAADVPETPAEEPAKPAGGDYVGLAALGLVGAGAAAFVLSQRGSSRTESSETVQTADELAPLAPWTPPQTSSAQAAARTVTRFQPLEPISLRIEPEFRQSEFAITAAEQRAIDQWDRSAEKQNGGLLLEDWLDLNAGRLQNVDVSRLKAKLHRDV